MTLADQASAPTVERSMINPSAETDPDADVFIMSHEELQEAIRSTLDHAGCTLGQLRAEANSGDFSSESNWLVWFCISPFLEEAFGEEAS